jgi:hypothetical protein
MLELPVSDECLIRQNTRFSKGIKMSEGTKKPRAPKLGLNPFIRAMLVMRHDETKEDDYLPTVHDLTKFINTHQWSEKEGWKPNPEGMPNGIRTSLSIASKLSQARGEVEGMLPKLGQEKVETLLAILEVATSKKEVDFDSIVSDIESLKLLRVPGNMIQKGSGAIGTNGQPVMADWVETDAE